MSKYAINLPLTLHQVPKVSTIEGFRCIQDTLLGPQGATIEGFHCSWKSNMVP